jgi:hypothetical protein
MKKITPVVQDVRFFLAGLKMSVGNVILGLSTNKRRNTMSVATNTYKVGDLYTSQKSKVTGTILAIDPQANGNVRVKLDVNGMTRYTTWTPKQ